MAYWPRDTTIPIIFSIIYYIYVKEGINTGRRKSHTPWNLHKKKLKF